MKQIFDPATSSCNFTSVETPNPIQTTVYVHNIIISAVHLDDSSHTLYTVDNTKKNRNILEIFISMPELETCVVCLFLKHTKVFNF